MNSTNRALNRTLVAVVGLLALLVGVGLIVVATDAAVRAAYRRTGPALHADASRWLASMPLGGTGTSWGWVIVLVVLALIVALLLVFIFRQGRGHDRVLLREGTSPAGTTIVDADVAEHAIRADLDGIPEILSSRVSTYRVRRTAVLKVSVTCRRGASPRQVAGRVEESLWALDALLGQRIPALIQLSGGFRARMSGGTRRTR